MKKDNKIIVLMMLAAGAIILLSLAGVNAQFYACFSKGQKINFCNPATPDRTCTSSFGCFYCMNSFNADSNCYNQGSINACNSIPFECSTEGGSPEIDSEPPQLTINDPINGEIYTDDNLLINLNTDEEADVSYLDNINGKGKWTRVCSDCMSYNRKRNLEEGLNNLTFKAADALGNAMFKDLAFFVDSREPSISRTEPGRNDFASGNFGVEFREENPESLVLHFGNNNTGWQSQNIDLDSECLIDRSKKTNCETDTDLDAYNGQELYYWFELTDIADQMEKSKIVKVYVDTSAPIINNFEYFIDDGRVTFNMTIIEENFDEAEYIDNSATRPRWSSLCGSLKKDNTCKKTVSLRDGEHSIDIQILDEAGNSIGTHVDITLLDGNLQDPLIL